MNDAIPASRPALTRLTILRAAFLEFYRNGFQGGSLNRIVQSAGVTKGALFHYFDGKQALGYAVVEEVIEPLLAERWIEPVTGAADPIAAIQASFRRYIRTDIDSGSWTLGCPLNNVAQEMSPLDEGFRERVDGLYHRWRTAYAAALEGAKESGEVRREIDATGTAALIVASQTGIWGTGKYSQDEALMVGAGEAVCAYLDLLRA